MEQRNSHHSQTRSFTYTAEERESHERKQVVVLRQMMVISKNIKPKRKCEGAYLTLGFTGTVVGDQVRTLCV